MDNKQKKERKELICAVTAVVVLYTAMESIGITCPIKFITGISCAGCGMSRAWIAFLQLDMAKAFEYHPLFLLPPIAVIVLLSKSKINIKIYKIFIFTIVLMFAIVYICRLIWSGDDIVVFEPQNNILFRIIRVINSK
ncbi:MAG TPA: DUF2752 domain-containing protein [Eubacterium sp.]|nr:DUF2752 domain-containing protein [Eubacterium sp.]